MEENWKKFLQKTPEGFNGASYRLEQFSTSDKLELKLSIFYYKDIKGLPIEELREKYSSEYFPHALCCSLFMETTDGYVIFGQKTGQDRIVGGGYSPDEITVDDGEAIYAMARQELMEETSIQIQNILMLELKGMVETNNLNIALVFKGKTSLTKDQVLEGFRKHHDPEFDTLEFIPISKLATYMELKHPQRKALLDYFY